MKDYRSALAPMAPILPSTRPPAIPSRASSRNAKRISITPSSTSSPARPTACRRGCRKLPTPAQNSTLHTLASAELRRMQGPESSARFSHIAKDSERVALRSLQTCPHCCLIANYGWCLNIHVGVVL